MPKAPELHLVLRPLGLRVLIAGGGRVAAQKLKALPSRGLAGLSLVSPSLRPETLRLAKARGAKIARRKARLADLRAADLIFAATNDPQANAALAKAALKARKWISVADQPGLGNFSLAAVASAGGIRVSISTGGGSPAVSKALRRWLEARLKGSKLLGLLAQLSARRSELKADPKAKAGLLKPLRDPNAFKKLLKP